MFNYKSLLKRLREEYNAHQKSLKNSIAKTALEERRFNLSSALSRARKQHITVTRSSSANSISDESEGKQSIHSSPEHQLNPVRPHDISQAKFLNYFSLATHEVFREMQNKRAERKRRSTANPHFLYGNKGWDFFGPTTKRKRSAFLTQPISPPNTRQATRKRQERVSPTVGSKLPSTNDDQKGTDKFCVNGGCISSPVPFGSNVDLKSVNSFPIPNLPSGLIIERVSPCSNSPDSKSCIICKQPGALTICERCSNGFHVSCHNRPLTQTPRQCPKCILKEKRTIGALNVPSGMSVSYVPSTEYTEKLNLKKELEEKRQHLSAELTQLQNRHSQLTISLRNQQSEQEKLLMNQQSTEAKVSQILQFIDKIKNCSPNEENGSL
ncbi:PHD finger protein 21A-like isoform X2 [Cylas formicarius]|uniref:PHD finger protein 21A-like isoform X2 n=1 Tax=Cylas formicarius TaxID=197179 RepID=UPI002958D468|nr:PHD finger protein 21A-like isoform X2 [Cylas formicarius]XP_060530375.1 PHD finger protein 21A-like isoform X2 [Cylas formicarius]